MKRVIPHGVGKCHEVTKGTGSRQELDASSRADDGQTKKSETRVKCEKVKNDKHQMILAVFGAGEGNRTPVFSLGS